MDEIFNLIVKAQDSQSLGQGAEFLSTEKTRSSVRRPVGMPPLAEPLAEPLVEPGVRQGCVQELVKLIDSIELSSEGC